MEKTLQLVVCSKEWADKMKVDHFYFHDFSGYPELQKKHNSGYAVVGRNGLGLLGMDLRVHKIQGESNPMTGFSSTGRNRGLCLFNLKDKVGNPLTVTSVTVGERISVGLQKYEVGKKTLMRLYHK